MQIFQSKESPGTYVSKTHFTIKTQKKRQKKRRKEMKKIIIAVVVLVVLVAAMALAYGAFREKPVEGSKAVTIEVVDDKGEATMYELQTDAQYLADAMKEAEIPFETSEGPYGLTVDSVHGISGVFGVDAGYWGFFVNGEDCNYGISEQPVEDGDAFQIVYTLN